VLDIRLVTVIVYHIPIDIIVIMATQKPYQYEPRYETEEGPQDIDNTEAMGNNRKEGLNWCKCGCCVLMSSEAECHCCQDSTIISNRIEPNTTCIVHHSSFENVIINIEVLNTARHHMILHEKDVIKKKIYMKTNNRIWRHVAYKQFVYWINSWVTLGKNNRKVIPSCVVHVIRETFPDEENNYTGFKRSQATNGFEYFY
jgi:hypothetical protein